MTPGAVVANRFEIVRLLGRGGMGSVWLARHVELDIPCAVKFIEAHYAKDPGFRLRFSREARAAAQLRSPNVVQILDSGEWQGLPYIAMELLEGEDLSARLKRQRRLGPSECVEIVSQVARALTKAHAAGVVHRDLKPDNIFLAADDDRLLVKIVDFGVAKQSSTLLEGQTQSGALLGTPFYMSPEQARGTKAVDHRSDLWALGVIVFQCITGRRPFESDGLGELLIKIITDPLPVPSQIAPDVPPSFDLFWARAASRAPEGRYQTAKELADALATSLGISVTRAVGLVPPGTSSAPLPHSGTVLMTPEASSPSGSGLGAGMAIAPGLSAAVPAPQLGQSASAAFAATSPPKSRSRGVVAFSVAGVVVGGIAAALVTLLPRRAAHVDAAAEPKPAAAATNTAPAVASSVAAPAPAPTETAATTDEPSATTSAQAREPSAEPSAKAIEPRKADLRPRALAPRSAPPRPAAPAAPAPAPGKADMGF